MAPKKVRSHSEFSERLIRSAEKTPGLKIDLLGKVRAGGTGYPFWMITTPSAAGRRDGAPQLKEVCLSGGIHGDEPAGAEGILGAIELLREKPIWMERFRFTLFPCVNPFGYEHHTRENGSRIDLNRQFARKRPPAEVRFLRRALDPKAFHLSIEFHEDVDTPGFYLYEVCRNPREGVAEKIVARVKKHYPINLREEIEGLPAKGGIIRPDPDSPHFKKRLEGKRQWPQAFYHYDKGTRHTLTSETPVHLDMRNRVEIHMMALETALEAL